MQGDTFRTRVQHVGTSVPACSPAFPTADDLDDVHHALFARIRF